MAETLGKAMPESFNKETKYIRKCGLCRNPCALKWMPSMEGKEFNMFQGN